MTEHYTSVQIKVITQGDAVCGCWGYMLKKSTNVAAFYLDGKGHTGRIYPVCSSALTWDGVKHINCPTVVISDGSDDGSSSEICFPEFEGWEVHSLNGGKTLAICLVKEE